MIEPDKINFIVFLMLGIINILVIVFFANKYLSTKEKIKEEIKNTIEKIEDIVESNSLKQIEVLASYIKQVKEYADTSAYEQEKQLESIKNLKQEHIIINKNFYNIVKELKQLEEKINKEIAQKNGKLHRKDKEINKLKDRIKKLEELTVNEN